MTLPSRLYHGGDKPWVVPDNWDPSGLSICRSCGAEVLWMKSQKSGKTAPFDQDGTSHFATCPQADQWRKR